jgi:hypothetical protein
MGEFVGSWIRRAAIVGLALVVLAIGFCLFDGDAFPSHAFSPDLCMSLALFAVAVVLLRLAANEDIAPTPRVAVYVTSLRHPTPPPRLSRSK